MSLAFAPEPDWGRASGALPAVDVCDVGVDGHDNVYVFARDALPVRVFARDGAFLGGWGEGEFVRPHGLAMGRDGASVFLTDEGSHSVRKYSLDGTLLLEIAAPKGGAPLMSGVPFNRCTHSAETSNGDVYVSDGYGNARIHRFSATGAFIASWGESGSGPGQFNLPHNITVDAHDRLYVADRENHRVQIFGSDGGYLDQWNNLHRPCALTCAADGAFYVGELGPALAFNRHFPNLGCAVRVLSEAGVQLARFGDERPGLAPTQFIAPHGIAVDSRGDVYVAEVSHTVWPKFYPDQDPPADLPSLRKWKRIAA
jgi:sugar lactone lactonase YvrE